MLRLICALLHLGEFQHEVLAELRRLRRQVLRLEAEVQELRREVDDLRDPVVGLAIVAGTPTQNP